MLLSADSRVQALADRFARLRGEAARIDAMLGAYAATTFACDDGRTVPRVDPLRHHAMLDDEACGCAVCTDWATRRGELDRAMRFVPAGHRWSICACPDCRFVGRLQLNYMAAANLRDLMIEVAFHAAYHSRHGERIMAWFEAEVAGPRYTTKWCAYELGRRSVEECLARCERDLSPVLSGAVFVAGEGKRDALAAWMPSQIGAVCAFAPLEAA